MKGTKKFFCLVDETLPEGQEPEVESPGFVTRLFSPDEFMDFIDTQDWQKFYKQVNGHVDYFAQSAIRRDRIVADQVSNFIKNSKKHNFNPVPMALVVGYIHNPEPLIAELIPEITITQSYYNMPLGEHFEDHPVIKIYIEKMNNPDKSVDPHLIDRMLYWVKRTLDEEPSRSLALSINHLANKEVHKELSRFISEANKDRTKK